jgi:hypothetical protein
MDLRGRRSTRIALLLCVCVASSLLLQAQGNKPGPGGANRNPNFKDGGYSEILDKLGIPRPKLQPQMKPVDLATWPKDGAVHGLAPTRLKGERAGGLSPNALPGVKLVSLDEVRKMDIARSSGLYVVGTDFIPKELPEILRSKGLRLEKDGRLLDGQGQSAAAFITSEVYLMSQQGTKQSSLHGFWNGLMEGLTPSAEAASPFPFRCFSFTPWALYHSGFHRWYEADTWAAAYGVDGQGGCSNASPHTRIDYLQTRAAVGWPGSVQHCFNCEAEHSHDEWDVGWFWPAHGIPTTTHSGVWADGSFSFSRTAHLSW